MYLPWEDKVEYWVDACAEDTELNEEILQIIRRDFSVHVQEKVSAIVVVNESKYPTWSPKQSQAH